MWQNYGTGWQSKYAEWWTTLTLHLLHSLVVHIWRRQERRAVALAEPQRRVPAHIGRPRARGEGEGPPRAALAIVALHLVDPPQRQQALHHPRPAGRCVHAEDSITMASTEVACRALSNHAQTVLTCVVAIRLPLLYTLQHGQPPKRQEAGALGQSQVGHESNWAAMILRCMSCCNTPE